MPAIFDVYSKTGDELQKAVQDAQETLKTLEQALKGKKFFGGETIGYLDIIVGWLPCLLRMVEDLAEVSVVNSESLPLINAWFDDFLDVEVVKENLPPKDKMYELNKARREQLVSGQLKY